MYGFWSLWTDFICKISWRPEKIVLAQIGQIHSFAIPEGVGCLLTTAGACICASMSVSVSEAHLPLGESEVSLSQRLATSSPLCMLCCWIILSSLTPVLALILTCIIWVPPRQTPKFVKTYVGNEKVYPSPSRAPDFILHHNVHWRVHSEQSKPELHTISCAVWLQVSKIVLNCEAPCSWPLSQLG